MVTTSGLWNDISCYHKLGGVICKKNCANSCPTPPTTTTTSTSTTPSTTTSTSSTTTTTSTTPSTTTSTSTTPSTTTTLSTSTTTKPHGGGYICGSDDWEWTYDNATGKAYAYKLFNRCGNYWKVILLKN
jgi:hypothetical protein